MYEWNLRDQLRYAKKYTGAGSTYAGRTEYHYCLTCDGAPSKRFEFGAETGSASMQATRDGKRKSTDSHRPR